MKTNEARQVGRVPMLVWTVVVLAGLCLVSAGWAVGRYLGAW